MLAFRSYFGENIFKFLNTIHPYLCIPCHNFNIFRSSVSFFREEINNGFFMFNPRLSTMLYKNKVLKFNFEEVI